ncbi:MAG TPA: hypothetical protein VMT30_06090 [Candidatus Saccharimonadia bacterium]|nr:hypothetical protein [Candidatus Saccharimonadia bacterium]
MERRTKIAGVGAGLGLATLLLAGCSTGTGGTSATGSSPASAAASTKAAQPKPPAAPTGKAYTDAQLAECRGHLDVTATATVAFDDATSVDVAVTPPATKVAAQQALTVFDVTPQLAHWETGPDLVICDGTVYLNPGNIQVPLKPGRTVAGWGPGRGTTIAKVVLRGHLTLVKRGQGG